jgi:hypothetical protein
MAVTSAQRGLTVDQINKSTITARNGFTGSTQECLSEQEQAASLINKVLADLKGACPGWRSSIQTKEDYDSMRQQWLIGFLENGITSDMQIEAGMAKARLYSKPYLPSVGQFIGWCKASTEPQWPPMEACYAQIMEFVRSARKDSYNLPQFLYHTITKNLDMYTFRKLEKEYERVKSFEVAYKATLFQLETGNELISPPDPKTLLESDKEKPVSKNVIEKTADIRAGILGMFKDPDPKPLTAADIKDNENLMRIRNEQNKEVRKK